MPFSRPRTLRCSDATGVTRTYVYDCAKIQDVPEEYLFRVYAKPLNNGDHWFNLTIRPIDSNTLLSMFMDATMTPQYRGKGIPEALLIEIARCPGVRIVSCSNRDGRKLFKEESRNCKATKVWLRLQDQGLASYCPDTDRYSLPPAP